MTQSGPLSSVPADLARSGGRSLFNVAPLYMAIGDQLDELLNGLSLERLPVVDTNQTDPVLALVTIFQFAEGLSDLQAAEALRTRLDWKYALHLPIDCPGPDCSKLDKLHRQLQASIAGRHAFEDLLARLETIGLWRRGSKESAPLTTDRVLGCIGNLNRLERCMGAMSAALQALAARRPEWLLTIIPPYWYDRYHGEPAKGSLPTAQEQQDTLMRAIETDILYLLKAIEQADLPDLVSLPEVNTLRQTWHQECPHNDEG